MEEVKQIAAKKGCTPGQLALAWVMAQWDRIVPIPGTTRVEALDENVGSANVSLSQEELKEIRSTLKKFPIAGDRYPGAMMKAIGL